tara:strand:- start:6834 stop:6983 length:150 start_codon:yes stop_codon:yes gene_type:complete
MLPTKTLDTSQLTVLFTVTSPLYLLLDVYIDNKIQTPVQFLLENNRSLI